MVVRAGFRNKYLWLGLSTALGTSFVPASALAQSVAEIPPTYVSADENGVDPVTGSFNFSMVEGSIGEGNEVLAMERYWGKSGWGDNWTGNLYLVHESGQNVIYISFGNISEKFTASSSGYVNAKGKGASLTVDTLGGVYVYTAADGTVITYREPYISMTEVTMVNGGCKSVAKECALPETIVRPGGHKISLNWETVIICNPGAECHSVRMRYRLKTVSDNRGYKMDISYMADGTTLVAPPGWFNRKNIKFSNRSVDYSGTAEAWPTVTYNHSVANQLGITDAAGRLWRFTTSGIQLTGIKSPANSSDNVTVAYGANGVTSVNDGTSTWTYNRTVSGTTATTIRTDALGQTRKTISNLSSGRPTSVENELGKVTSFHYNAVGQLIRLTRPENDYTTYAYDPRGNVLTTTAIGKPSSGAANIVTSATYPATCANPVLCNKPLTTTDAKGQVTDYAYDPVHGGLTSITLPAATTGAPRPQTRYAYSALSAWLRTSPSTIAVGSPIYRLTSVSGCATTASCVGTADESKTIIDYQSGSSTTATNLLPVSVSARSGDDALVATSSFTWDKIGNRLTVDGPLVGTGDTTRFRYDAARQVEGIVGPDPDGSAARKHQATRFTYNGDGLVTKSEAGTVDDPSDTAWAAFAPAETVTSSYNVSGLKTKDVLSAGGTEYAAAQYSYDATGRLDCTAQRMNPAAFGSLPASACTAGTEGSAGPDRIVKKSYDAAGRITKVQTAYGVTGVQADEVTTAYTNNGQVDYVIDAENNRTEYSYDGHDRLVKTEYPSATKGANAANAADYEQLGYDAASNVTSRRLRDGTSIGYGYDNLNRLVSKDLPGSEPDATYSYDLMGRATGATQDAQTLAFVYDALGRKVGESIGYLGATAYGYDAAGRRTSITYPGGGLVVSYDYDTTGNVTAIRENGATSGAGVLAAYAFDDLGRRTSVTFGNGSVQSFAYDPVSRLATLTNDLGGSATTHDLTQTFSYNPANQIASVTRSNDAYAWQAHYNVDRSYVADGLNRIMNAGSTVFGYDARGNLTSDGTNSYGYTAENMLATGPGSAALSYDPVGRLKRTYSSALGTTWYGYDGVDLTSELDSVGNVLRRYVHGPGTDNPIVWYEGGAISNTTRRFLMADERGSIVSVTDSAGATININAYDEYGIPAPGNVGRFGYTGQTWLPELGMWHYKARIYSPTLGRFMQTDPIGYSDGMNWYNYVGSDPVNGSDSFGLAVDQKLKRLLNSKKPIVPSPPEDLEEIVVTGSRQQPSPPLPPIPVRDIGWPSDTRFSFKNAADNNNAPAGKPENGQCANGAISVGTDADGGTQCMAVDESTRDKQKKRESWCRYGKFQENVGNVEATVGTGGGILGIFGKIVAVPLSATGFKDQKIGQLIQWWNDCG